MECPRCYSAIDADAMACPACGTPRTLRSYTPRHLAEFAARSAKEGERRTVTVLFCDVVNSTGLAERIGPDAMYQMIKRFFALAARHIHRYEGTINQFMGDGFMALFGAPVAHEDHARRAVIAALETRDAVAAQRSSPLGIGDEFLMVRIGLHTGPVVIGTLGDDLRMDFTAVGDTMNLAARLQQTASPGSICLSATTHRLVRLYVECLDLGQRTVKNREQPVHVYSAVQAKPRPLGEGSNSNVPIIGRESEVARLREQVERLQLGQGGVVLIVGEAGLGKSRLVREVRRDLTADVTLLEGRTVSFGQTISYWPFIESVKGYLGIADEDDNEAAWQKLDRVIRSLFPDDGDEILPYLGSFLALDLPSTMGKQVDLLDAEAMGRQVLLNMRRLFERVAAKRPTLLVIEDLHWMDQSSRVLLEHLLPLVDRVPLLVCCTSRPDPGVESRLRISLAEQYPGLYSEILLRPLAGSHMSDLIRGLLSEADVPGAFVAALLRKADGNPFFAEEAIAALRDLGVLAWEPTSKKWRLTRPVEEIAIPDNVQAAIMARLDRLEQDAKEILKTASVIGRNFLYRIVRAVADQRDALDRHLGDLVVVDLLRQDTSSQEVEYWFKHALVQQVTYDTILDSRRKELHLRVAQSIEDCFGARLEEFFGLLAFHFTRAEAWDKAQEYLVKAGDQAGRLAGDAEALEHYRQAFDTYMRTLGDKWDVRQRAFLKRRIGETLFRRGEHDEAIEYFQGALQDLGGSRLPDTEPALTLAIASSLLREIAYRAGPWLFGTKRSIQEDLVERERVRVYEAMAWIDFFRLPKRMLLDALLATKSSERVDPSQPLVQGLFGMGIVCDMVPIRRFGRFYHQRAVAIAEGTHDPIALGYAYLGLGFHQQMGGEWDAAISLYQRSATEFKKAGHLRGWGKATSTIDWVLLLRGDFAQSRRVIEEIIRIGRESADQQLLAWGLMDSGALAVWSGAYGKATSDLESAIVLFDGVPDYQSLAVACGYLGDCYLRQDKIGKALEVLSRGEQLVSKYGFRGPFVVPIVYGRALAFLLAAEKGDAKTQWMKKAKPLCRTARRLGKWVPEAYVMACRLQGTYEWLQEDKRAAKHWWSRSATAAKKLGARYELGLTYLESGRCLGSTKDLEHAQEIFTVIGAEVDRERAGRLRRESLHRKDQGITAREGS